MVKHLQTTEQEWISHNDSSCLSQKLSSATIIAWKAYQKARELPAEEAKTIVNVPQILIEIIINFLLTESVVITRTSDQDVDSTDRACGEHYLSGTILKFKFSHYNFILFLYNVLFVFSFEHLSVNCVQPPPSRKPLAVASF